ncbi:hypothetical protein CFI10_11520 [Marinobacterium iners]|uniref:hypothetical protein n=1 Tax=Marinobacterium iners TaxID=48076 RepID=UPI001A8E1426|nr:hypothetical protein [Marinobacterium iners]QSR35618.1 hypothetical protein CFI10_11520 [Marinobacterium iners]
MNELIVLEIPHREPAQAWTANNQKDYIEKVAEEFYSKNSSLNEIENPTFDDYVEAASEDLYGYRVMTVKEAIEAYQTDGESIKLGDHQKWKALLYLEDKLYDLGVAYKKDSELKEFISEYREYLDDKFKNTGKTFAEIGETRKYLEIYLKDEYNICNICSFHSKNKYISDLTNGDYNYVIGHMADELREPQLELINKELEVYDQEVMRLQQAKSKKNRSRMRP